MLNDLKVMKGIDMTQANLQMTSLRIDLISDVVCPWCIIGYKQLEQALKQLGNPASVEVHLHPFEINPDTPAGGTNLRAHLAKKYGTTPEASVQARERLTQLGDELGFAFDYFDEMKTFNSFKAHQLLMHAKMLGKESELKLRLFSAYFGERQEIDQDEVLIAEAAKVGIDEESARQVLNSGSYAKEVKEIESHWTQRGVRGVPCFVFNGEQAISGAQGVETLTKLINSYL